MMNKTITITAAALFSLSPIANAKILPPVLISPQHNENIGIKQPLKFSWTTKNAATIKQYHPALSRCF